MNINPIAGIRLLRVVLPAAREALAFPEMLLGAALGAESPQAQTAQPDTLALDAAPVERAAVAAPVETAADQYRANLARLREEIGKLFLQHSIDTSAEVALARDETGRVTVRNDRPDKGRIEALLNQQPELVDRFTQVERQFLALRDARLGLPPGYRPQTYGIGDFQVIVRR